MNKTIRLLLFYTTALLFSFSIAQAQTIINGTVSLNNGTPVDSVEVLIRNVNLGGYTNTEGAFSILVPSKSSYSFIIYKPGYKIIRQKVFTEGKDTITVTFNTAELETVLEDVEVKANLLEEVRNEVSMVALSPETVKTIPSPFSDFNQGLISGGVLGIRSNNELSSNYSVRGGSYDENLVYVNNIPIYRPQLAKTGQQEGLSFVNPNMVQSVYFSSGGWQANYGDKLSSVLSISYKTPKHFAASAEASLLGTSLHVEGTSKDKKVTHVTGFRYKSGQYLLNTLETEGEYFPNYLDFQSFINVDISGKNRNQGTTHLGLLVAYSDNDYLVEPKSRETEFGYFNNVQRFNASYYGHAQYKFNTFQSGLKLKHKFSNKFQTELIASGAATHESNYTNIISTYHLCSVEKNPNATGFNNCLVTLGAASELDYNRNWLHGTFGNIESRNKIIFNENFNSQFGLNFKVQNVEDYFYEYNLLDSADFTEVTEFAQSESNFQAQHIEGYYQNTHFFGKNTTLTYGLRANYRTLNKELLLSPRVQFSFKPASIKKDIIFNTAFGYYQQPPIFREMRGKNGQINLDLKAQKSIHALAGMDYNLKIWDRPFKFLSEVYYKYLWDVVPYDIENIEQRYYAENSAIAYVVGTDIRLSGEFIEGTESWVNLGVLSTQEDILTDTLGWMRRPTDQRVTFALFFRDHIPNQPTLKVHMRFLYGSGLPYGPPNVPAARNALSSGTEYQRVDIGFSKTFERIPQKIYGVENVILSLEVLNLFGRSNHISYNWIKDFNNGYYAVPNSLSQRFINLKLRIEI